MNALTNGTKMCVLSPMTWIDAMKHCQSLGGTPSSNVYIPKSIIHHLTSSSLWTSDYAALKPTIGNDPPYWCEYITIGADDQVGGVQVGNCTTERTYLCCENGTIGSRCTRTGPWYQTKVCKELHSYSEMHNLTSGDYWLNNAYSVENYTFQAQYNTTSSWSLPTVSRCGFLEVNGDFQFVNDCSMEHYSVCVIPNYPAGGIADCIQTKTSPLSYSVISTTDAQTTVKQNVSQSRDSRLSIGLGVGFSLCGLVVIIVGIAVYIRRKSQSRDTKNGRSNTNTAINATYMSDNQVDCVKVLECSGETEDRDDPYCTITDGIRKSGDNEVTMSDLNPDVSSPYESYFNVGQTQSFGGNTQFGKRDHMSASNTVMNTVYFSNTSKGEDPDYVNTDVMSDEYDSNHFSETMQPILLNENNHLGDEEKANNYNAAS
ncbi:hypothetical protein DPMN_167485 [Dreissena polymorpha]|uniref:Uncharacterized protein n=3 Tax=Dreissena polymorpha TaxID=45954 RepID=A0A9D4EYY0_DREPO|nr:hypothetical protein DPMN_167485 [Dreissena polymorpha]